MTKSFVVVAAIFILVGGSIGGAFTGGVILGRNQAESEAPAAANFVPPQDFAGQAAALRQMAGQFPASGAEGRGSTVLREGFAGTAAGQDSLSAASDSPTEAPASSDDAGATAGAAGQPGFSGFGRGLGPFGGGGATFGTIDSIGEGVVVINTPQGPVEAAISSETVIQVFSAGVLDDLEEGMSVTVMGQEDAESGKLEAMTVIVLPGEMGAMPVLPGSPNRPRGGFRP